MTLTLKTMHTKTWSLLSRIIKEFEENQRVAFEKILKEQKDSLSRINHTLDQSQK